MEATKKRSSATPEQGLMCSSRSGWKSSQGAAANEVSGGVLQLDPGAKLGESSKNANMGTKVVTTIEASSKDKASQ